MSGYTTHGWENFFVAEAGASAALSGLLFVAVSINLARVLETPHSPRRTARALLLLVSVLFVATLGLVPGQSPQLLAGELLLLGVLVWGSAFVLDVRAPHNPHVTPRHRLMNVVLVQMATLPLLVAGATLFLGSGGGLYWVVPFTLLSIVAAVFDAWVLLIEIMR